MAKWLHRAPFHQAISGAPRPGVEPCIRELHSPAEMADQGGKTALINPSEPGFGAEVIDQDDLAAGLDDAGELVERSLRIRHRRDHVLRHHYIEERIGKTEPLGIHHRKHFHMVERAASEPGLGAAEHRFREVDADDPIARRILGERNSRAHADVENASADTLRGSYGGRPASRKHGAEDYIVDRRPASIGFFHHVLVECVGFKPGLAHRPTRFRFTSVTLVRPYRPPHAGEGREGAGRTAATASISLRGAADRIKPPPSMRAWPRPAS